MGRPLERGKLQTCGPASRLACPHADGQPLCIFWSVVHVCMITNNWINFRN